MREPASRGSRRENNQGSSGSTSAGFPACSPPDMPAPDRIADATHCARAVGTKRHSDNTFAALPCPSSSPRKNQKEYDNPRNGDRPVSYLNTHAATTRRPAKKEENDPFGSGGKNRRRRTFQTGGRRVISKRRRDESVPARSERPARGRSGGRDERRGAAVTATSPTPRTLRINDRQ